MTPCTLTGLDGTNPLAFLAAVGVVEALADARHSATLQWVDHETWQPVIGVSEGGDVPPIPGDIEPSPTPLHGAGSRLALTPDVLVSLLEEDRRRCVTRTPNALTLEYEGKRDLKPSPVTFRGYLDRLAADLATRHDPDDRCDVDWAASFGSDVVQDNNGNTKPTALHFTAGQQQFLKMALELGRGVTQDDFHEALFGPWTYSRSLPVYGWDATASRDYALRASDPSKEKKLGVPAADWLALRALPSFPVAPRRSRLLTTGCAGGWKDGSFHWPLWHPPLTRPTIRTLLRLPLLDMPSDERLARGIADVLRSGITRSDQGGYGSFQPAEVVDAPQTSAHRPTVRISLSGE